MKAKYIFPFWLIGTILICSCSGGKSEKDGKAEMVTSQTVDAKAMADSTKPAVRDTTTQTKKTSGAHVLVYYFHAAHRCATCIAIEKAVNEVLSETFSIEVKTGIVKLVNVNADEEANNAICDKYEAFGTALFVTRVKGNEEKKTDMTAEAFKLAGRKKDEFKKLLREQILTNLK